MDDIIYGGGKQVNFFGGIIGVQADPDPLGTLRHSWA
jgi:hypothetical protein